jgi:hypothetical protein
MPPPASWQAKSRFRRSPLVEEAAQVTTVVCGPRFSIASSCQGTARSRK